MIDFSPYATKSAARLAVADYKANGFANWSEHANGAYSATFNGLECRVALDGKGGLIGRVIDTDGRHYFPAEFDA